MSALEMLKKHTASALVALLLTISGPGAAASPAPDAAASPALDQSAKKAPTQIVLPARMPAGCLKEATERYQLRPDILLAIFKVESGGKAGVEGVNRNQTKDLGVGQLNTDSWAKYMVNKYGIPLDTLKNNMCQGIMSSAYALRSEMNRCIKGGFRGADAVWCSVAVYHHGGALPVPTANAKIREIQKVYVSKVWAAYQRIVAKGRFE
ncbi:lytic transglycosylase domain-containing protein [Achromobacter spanius]|uniref:lytic transglycosylase domain-containing protein n=1 Tax=Achromobacter spanius TaxID=217203 RepID=UPI0037F7C56D